MPLYVFKCSVCGNVHKKCQGYLDPAPPCPAETEHGTVCGGESFRQIAVSSFQLKGSGWYKTDYS